MINRICIRFLHHLLAKQTEPCRWHAYMHQGFFRGNTDRNRSNSVMFSSTNKDYNGFNLDLKIYFESKKALRIPCFDLYTFDCILDCLLKRPHSTIGYIANVNTQITYKTKSINKKKWKKGIFNSPKSLRRTC